MRDKMQCFYPYRGLTRDVPAEASPMHMSLRQRRVVPIEITEKAMLRHAWYRKKKFYDALRAKMNAA